MIEEVPIPVTVVKLISTSVSNTIQWYGRSTKAPDMRNQVYGETRQPRLVEVLELYKNNLGDASAQALSVLLENSPKPGVHRFPLSHSY